MTFFGNIPARVGTSAAPSLGGTQATGLSRHAAAPLDSFGRAGISPSAALGLQVRTQNLSVGLRTASGLSAARHQASMNIIRNMVA